MTTTTPPPVQPPPVQPPPSSSHGHRGRWIAAIAGVAVLAGGLGAGIGVAVTNGSSKPQSSTSQPAKPKAPASQSAPAPASAAAANDLRFMNWMASGPTGTAGVKSTVAGGTMRGYVSFQATMCAAYAAAGEPVPLSSVTAIPGGYQLAGDDGNGGTTVQTFTAFEHNAAGQITGLQVNGQPIAPRLAVGPDNTGHLKITDVVAYKPAMSNEVLVAFNVKNVGGPLSNGDFQISFSPTGIGQLEADWQNSPPVPTLHPGESAPVFAAFGTRTPTGTLTLRSNDGYETVYATSTLTRP